MLAFNLASHSNEIWPNDSWNGRCIYWFFRLLIESMLFLGAFYLIWHLISQRFPLLCLFLGFLISWFLFVLTITMIDISLGRAEMGGINLNNHTLVFTGLFEEMYWILPKHFFFCLLVVLINFRIDYHSWFKKHITKKSAQAVDNDSIDAIRNNSKIEILIDQLPAKIRDLPLRIQAQEHYIKVTTRKGSDLILHTFGKIVAQLPEELGIQVHRSFWVANNNVKSWKCENNNYSLQLYFGEDVPVSRRHEQIVINKFKKL